MIVGGAVFMSAGIPAALAENAVVALAFISIVTFGFQSWINNVQTIPSDLFPGANGSFGCRARRLGVGIGAIIFTLTTGWVVDHFSYTPILVVAGLLRVLGTVILFALGGRIRRLSFASTEPGAVATGW